MTTPRLTSPGTLRPLLWLAWPVLAEEVLSLFVGYTEWWLTGHFLKGADYQAAMGLMAYMLWVIPSLFSAVAIGATALTARFVGGGDTSSAQRVLHQALLLGIPTALVGMFALFAGDERFIAWMQFQDNAAKLSSQYLAILVWVVPAIMFQQVTIACLRGAGDTVSGLLAKVVVNVVNACVSTVLVTGWGPFPKLGWQGLAYGAASGHIAGACVMLFLLMKGGTGLRLQWRELRWDSTLARRLMRVGIPGGCDVAGLIGCHLAYFAIISSLGPVASGAHGLGIQLEALAYAAGAAFQVAAATLTGQYLGANDAGRAAHAVRTTLGIGIGYYVIVGIVFLTGGSFLVSLFCGPDANELAQLATDYLRIVSYSFPSLAVVVVLTGALRGAGDTRGPLVVTFTSLVFVRVLGACFLAWASFTVPWLGWQFTGFDLGVRGAWYAMVADVLLRSGLLFGRYLQGTWRRVVV